MMTFAQLCRGCTPAEVQQLAEHLAMLRAQKALASVADLVALADQDQAVRCEPRS